MWQYRRVLSRSCMGHEPMNPKRAITHNYSDSGHLEFGSCFSFSLGRSRRMIKVLHISSSPIPDRPYNITPALLPLRVTTPICLCLGSCHCAVLCTLSPGTPTPQEKPGSFSVPGHGHCQVWPVKESHSGDFQGVYEGSASL